MKEVQWIILSLLWIKLRLKLADFEKVVWAEIIVVLCGGEWVVCGGEGGG